MGTFVQGSKCWYMYVWNSSCRLLKMLNVPALRRAAQFKTITQFTPYSDQHVHINMSTFEAKSDCTHPKKEENCRKMLVALQPYNRAGPSRYQTKLEDVLFPMVATSFLCLQDVRRYKTMKSGHSFVDTLYISLWNTPVIHDEVYIVLDRFTTSICH